MRFALIPSLVALVVVTAAAPQPPKEKARGISIPIFKRSNPANGDKTVSFEALHSEVANARAKLLRGFENFERNTGVKHPLALNEPQKRDSAAVPLLNYKDTFWYGNISVGTPPKTFGMLLDTDSSDLVLLGCNNGYCEGHQIYTPSYSSTSMCSDKEYEFAESGGSIQVHECNDTVSIAGLTVTDQTLGVGISYTYQFGISVFPPDGILGMGFQQASISREPTLFENLVSQGVISDPVFSLKLAQSGAELYIGGTNSSLYTGAFSYAPVTKEAFWQVKMDNIQGNGQTILSNINGIIDTGIWHIIGEISDVESLMNALGGVLYFPGQYAFPCDNFPSISLTFGGTSFPIPSSALNFGPVSPGSSNCLCGIFGSDYGTVPSAWAVWHIGNVFLQGVYTSFDMGNKQVGFATLAEV